MNRIFNTFIISYTLFMIVAGWGIAWLETGVFGLKDLGVYPLFPAFFWIWGILLMIAVKNTSVKNPLRVLNLYMIFKIGKNILAGAIALYVFFNITDKRAYMLVGFGFFYAASLVTETLYIYKTEQFNKKLKDKA